MLHNFKLTIEYDGTDYCGWQIQNNKSEIRNPKSEINSKSQIQNPKLKTVQGEVERALEKIFSKKISIAGSGRTDTGAHALAQVANFKCEARLKSRDIKNALNANLPSDIRIKAVNEVPLKFHARFSARSKVYRYLILKRPVNSVFYRRLSWWIPRKLNFSLMCKESKVLLGRHNFKAFAATDRKRKSSNFVRAVKRISLKESGNFIVFEIESDGFLYSMVRNIIGTLVEVGRGRFSAGSTKRILASRDRKLAGPTAPASGLFLAKVKY
ncbi:MAG: tRNA pseudouridine(38-40) synthase TruA [Candidatus Omnitrophica bacterium]|nr:tRNA pseudouridine(38-40) synthase TruA [Candidatus Omnitrophota bacterium]